MNFDFSQCLRGGAQGAQVSKRKREGRRTRQRRGVDLASALTEFLSSWQAALATKTPRKAGPATSDSTLATNLMQVLQDCAQSRAQDQRRGSESQKRFGAMAKASSAGWQSILVKKGKRIAGVYLNSPTQETSWSNTGEMGVTTLMFSNSVPTRSNDPPSLLMFKASPKDGTDKMCAVF